MFGNQYYHSIIRKYVIAFGNLFNDITIQRFDSDGNRIQTIAVPLSYSPKDKFIVRLRQDPNLDQDVAITLPRMGFEITSFNYSKTLLIILLALAGSHLIVVYPITNSIIQEL